MAGYMTKLQGYVYEGELANGTGAAVENGAVVKLGAVDGKPAFVKTAANDGLEVLCKEVRTVYDGIPAYEFIVTKVGTVPTYFVENGVEETGAIEFATTEYTTPNGDLLRAHPLVVGEEFVTTKVTGTPAVGQTFTTAADGTLAKKS